MFREDIADSWVQRINSVINHSRATKGKGVVETPTSGQFWKVDSGNATVTGSTVGHKNRTISSQSISYASPVDTPSLGSVNSSYSSSTIFTRQSYASDQYIPESAVSRVCL